LKRTNHLIAQTAPKSRKATLSPATRYQVDNALAVKTRPVVVHCLTSAIQMSAWRRYTRSATLP
jgi:hypothetical protein